MKKIICIMFISLCFFVSGCNSTGNNNIINNLSTKEYDDFIINTLITEYGIADLTQVDVYKRQFSIYINLTEKNYIL